ncbi:MAG: UbiA family prenyltransferase [Gemmatimonadaceae bacterium]
MQLERSTQRLEQPPGLAELLMTGRPGVAASAGVAAAAAARFGGATSALVLQCGGVAMLGAMVCMVTNDIYDIEKDRAAGAPGAIAAGRVSRRSALVYAGLLGAGALALAPHTPLALALAAVAIVMGVLYSAFARACAPLKGVYTAICCCLPIVYGAAVTGTRAGVLALASVVLFNVGRETFLDAHHAAGDQAFGLRTIAIVIGPPRARVWGIGAMFAGIGVALAAMTTPVGRLGGAVALAVLVLAVFGLRVDDEQLRQWTRVVLAAGAVAAASTVH